MCYIILFSTYAHDSGMLVQTPLPWQVVTSLEVCQSCMLHAEQKDAVHTVFFEPHPSTNYQQRGGGRAGGTFRSSKRP